MKEYLIFLARVLVWRQVFFLALEAAEPSFIRPLCLAVKLLAAVHALVFNLLCIICACPALCRIP